MRYPNDTEKMAIRNMRKSDVSIKNIVTASIKRHSMNIESWESTRLWDELKDQHRSYIDQAAGFSEGELGIIAYYQNETVWYVITTRGVIFQNEEEVTKVMVDDIEQWDFGDFKGIRSGGLKEEMKLQLVNGKTVGFIYETGERSMGPIYGVMTLVRVGRARTENGA
jgi:hypothetical protein